MKRALFLTCLAWAVTASAQVPNYVPTEELVLWWDMTTTSLDTIDHQLGGGILTENRFGAESAAIEFFGGSGSNGEGASFTNTYTGVQDEFTFAFWVKPDRAVTARPESGVCYPSVSTPMANSNQNWALYPANGGSGALGVGLSIGTNGVFLAEHCTNLLVCRLAHPTPISGFAHVVVTYTSTTKNLYLNGTLVRSASMHCSGVPKILIGTPVPGDTWPILLGTTLYSPRFDGVIDDYGVWSRALNQEEITALFEAPTILGCTDIDACNYDTDANVDDGSCIPSGCMDESACNYNADAQCVGEACDYSCCPGPGCCGEGMHWDAEAQTCVITPPSDAPDEECTLLNLQELAEGYQILLAQNAQLDSLLADCNGTSILDQSGPCSGEDVVNYHGYDYDIVEIGDQCWFAENLQSNYYRTGHEISQIGDDIGWSNATSGAVCAYPSSSVSAEIGLLYNWWSTVDYRGLCPPGWDIPSDYQWMQLEVELGVPSTTVFNIGYRGSNEGVGTSMKATDAWDSGVPGSNISGFRALPAGWRTENGAYTQLGEFTHWHSRSITNTGANYRGLGANGTGIARAASYREAGRSVRCVKD